MNPATIEKNVGLLAVLIAVAISFGVKTLELFAFPRSADPTPPAPPSR